ncbi:MAG: hypothetical protein AAF721_00455 [Myxococcota bacterium]
MATTTELRAQPGAHWAWLVLIDGSPYAFTTSRDLEDRVDFAGTGVDIRAYLNAEESSDLPTELDIRTGQFDPVTANLVLEDHSTDSLLASLFATRDPTEVQLAQTIEPGEDLTARTEVHDMHVGIEAIGSSGERRRFPAFRNCDWGLLHIGQNAELPDVEPAPVSANPLVWRGRWVAVYQCYRDHIDFPDRSAGPDSWRPFSEAILRWKGTLTDAGRVDGHRWELEADGPESLLRREVGALTQDHSAKVSDVIAYNTTDGDADDRIAIAFLDGIHDVTADPVVSYDRYGTDTDFSQTLTETTPETLLSEISGRVDTVAAQAGADGAFAGQNLHNVHMDPSDAQVAIAVEDNDVGTAPREAIMVLCMHKQRWADIGYDTDEQSSLPVDDDLYVNFKPYPDGTLAALGVDFGAAPGSDYVTGFFFTRPPDWTTDTVDNDGKARFWKPSTTGARVVLDPSLAGGAGQVLDLAGGLQLEQVYHRGQLDRPPASDPDDPATPFFIPGVGNVNRQGLWLFYGKRKNSDDAEPFDEYWVGRASWQTGSLAQAGQVDGARIVVTEWLPPRQFGYDRPKPSGQWIALADGPDEFRIRAVPLLHLGYQPGVHLSRADIVIDRLLRSTGTSTGWWTDAPTNTVPGYSGTPTAVLDAGDNEPGLAFGVRRDGEDADIGLGLPDEILANPVDLGQEFQALPGTKLGMTKLSVVPGMNSEDILDGLMRPHGWAWSLRGGRFGIFTIFDPIPLDGIDLVLSQSTKVRGRRSSQDLRALAPIDRFKLEYNFGAFLGKFRREAAFPSKDKGKRYRPGGIDFEVKAHGMTTATGFRERMRQASRWWERRHFFLENWAVMPSERAAVWVGDRVRVTEPRAVAPSGEYGVSQMAGVIVGTRLSLADGVTTCKVFVHEASNGFPRMNAVSARGIGYDDDEDRLYVADNWLAVPTAGTWSDAAYFVEPGYIGLDPIGGDARIVAIQWNGESWSLNLTATVDSVDTTPGASYLQLSNITGTYRYAMDTIVLFLDAGAQTAQWVLDLYGVTCTEAGTFDGGTAGYPWEP